MRNHLSTALFIILLVGLGVLAVSPASLATVTSGSMEPTLQTGDIYLIVPEDNPGVGDIITFYSEEKSEYVTHRVVSESGGGYVTKGDDNPVIDQKTGTPIITSEMIRGTVFQYDGSPVVLSGLAKPLGVVNEHRLLIVSVLLGLVGVSWIRETRNRRSHHRRRIKPPQLTYNGILIGVLVVAMVCTVGVIFMTAPTATYTPVVVESASSPAQSTLTVGESSPMNASIAMPKKTSSLSHRMPVVSGAEVVSIDRSPGRLDLELVVGPYTSPGAKDVRVTTYSYPALLPYGLLGIMHSIHPLLASFVSAGVFWMPVGSIMVLLVPRETRARTATIPGLQRLTR